MTLRRSWILKGKLQIRLKRLAKLQASQGPTTFSESSIMSSTVPSTSQSPKANVPHRQIFSSTRPGSIVANPPAPRNSVLPSVKINAVIKLDHAHWENQSVQDILRVTLSVSYVLSRPLEESDRYPPERGIKEKWLRDNVVKELATRTRLRRHM